MSAYLDLLSAACLMLGGILSVIGGIGILRLPEFFTRMHAVGITDTLCTGLILLGLALQAGWSAPAVKLLLIGGFVFLTSPTGTHALAKAAVHGRRQPRLDGEVE